MPATLTCLTVGGRERRAPLTAYLTPALREATRVEANAWIKRLRLVRYGEDTMRSRFVYRDDSLWWFTELYLHKERHLESAVAATLALDAAVAAHGPHALRLDEADAVTRRVGLAFGVARHLPVTVGGSGPWSRPAGWPGYLGGLTARLSRMRGSSTDRVRARASVAAFVHTAFLADSVDGPHDRYVGPVLDAVAARLPAGDLFFVGVGPKRNFRARRWWDPIAPGATHGRAICPVERLAPRQALDGALDLWRRRRSLAAALTAGDSVRSAATFRGCDLWAVLGPALEGAALVQWPWSARAMDEAGAALDAIGPHTAVTYAEAGGWGRALVLEARRRGVRSIGIQHGFIYRHWLNYRHEPDEFMPAPGDRGCPIPDRTLLFDAYAAADLETAGHFPPAALAVTGNARLDDLAARIAEYRREPAEAIRRRANVPSDRAVAVVTAKFTEIREELPALIAAVDALPGVHLAIKPHPAETADVYAPFVAGSPRVTILAADVELAHALAVADGVVTMNSTVAIDGLALGIASLVIGLPNNLSPFVEAGVMLGATGPEAIRPMLERLLYDRDARARLDQAARAFADRYAMRPTGDAAERAADEILRGPSSPGAFSVLSS